MCSNYICFTIYLSPRYTFNLPFSLAKKDFITKKLKILFVQKAIFSTEISTYFAYKLKNQTLAIMDHRPISYNQKLEWKKVLLVAFAGASGAIQLENSICRIVSESNESSKGHQYSFANTADGKRWFFVFEVDHLQRYASM